MAACLRTVPLQANLSPVYNIREIFIHGLLMPHPTSCEFTCTQNSTSSSTVSNGSTMATTDPKNVPALAPPSGVTPNFVNPYTLNPAFVVTTALCLLLATSAVIVRLAISLCGSTKRLRGEDCSSF